MPKLGYRQPEHVRRKTSQTLLGNKRRLGIPHTEETKARFSSMRSGAGNANWKGGVTPINRSIRTSSKYKKWRKEVFERDGYTCVFCGAKSSKGERVVLNADHILPFSTHIESRFDVSNGRTLCTPCHKETDTYAGKMRSYPKRDANYEEKRRAYDRERQRIRRENLRAKGLTSYGTAPRGKEPSEIALCTLCCRKYLVPLGCLFCRISKEVSA